MGNLRELLFEPCPYCPEYAEDNQPCRECDGHGFFLRDIIADCLGEELLEAVAAAEKTEAQRDALLAALEAVEWVLVYGPSHDGLRVCPWCGYDDELGHDEDCQRQASIALATTEGEK